MDVSSHDVFQRVLGHPASHLRVLGPPGSGKTRLLLERYRALERCGDTGAGGVFVLTYSTESHERLTNAIVEKNSAHLGPLPVLKYSRLAEEVIISSGKKRPVVVKGIEERLLLDKVIDDRQTALKSDFRSVCSSDRFREDTLDICHLLLQNDIDERALEMLGSVTAAQGELEDILMLYRGFRNEIEARGLATYYDISWIAARCCRDGVPDHPVMRASVILVEDFQDIDPGQFELLKTIAPPGGGVALNVFGDPLGSVFGRRGTDHRYLMEEFPKLFGGETFLLDAACSHHGPTGTVMAALLEEVLGPAAADFHTPTVHGEGNGSTNQSTDPLQSAGPPGFEPFRIETVRDEVDEAYAVVARIHRILSEKRYRPDDIAIVTNDKRRYEAPLRSAATQRGIPLDTGRSRHGVFDDFINALFILFDSPDDPIALRSILTSPLYRHLKDTVPAGRLEEAAGTAPAGGLEEAAGTAPAGRSGEAVGMKTRVRGRDGVEELRSFLITLARDARSRETEQWMRCVVDKCLHPVCRSVYTETGDDAGFKAACRLLEAWGAYCDALNTLGGRPSVRVFTRVSGLFSTGPAAPGSIPDAVGFYSCREAKGLFFPVVFVIGCSELLFPSAKRYESVVPSSALQTALDKAFPRRPVTVYAARSPADQLKDEYHLLMLGLTRATEILQITAPENFAGQEYPAPASILKETIPEPFYGSTPAEEKTPPQIRLAKEWVGDTHADGIEDRLARLSPGGALWRGGVLRGRADPVEIAAFPLSKSSIETFLACRRRFFYKKVLGIPEEEAAPAKVGSLLHAVMATLGHRYPTKRQLQGNVTEDVIRDVIDELIQGDDTIGTLSLFDRSLRYHLERMVEKIINLDGVEAGSYTITAVEKKLPFSYDGWEFSGRIDRVEETAPRESTIVDFKTGKFYKKGRTVREKTLDALDSPEKANWQVPLYTWGFRTREGTSPNAFKHVVTSSRDEAFAVTLFVCSDEDAVPPEARSDKRVSYVLETELEQIMKKAASVASEIFEPRTHFDRAGDSAPCRTCEFRRLCEREHG